MKNTQVAVLSTEEKSWESKERKQRMKKNYVFNDLENPDQIPFIIHDNTISHDESSWVFENCTVHFSKIDEINEKAEGMIVTIYAKNLTVSFNEEQSERIINSFLNKYGISRENVINFRSASPLTQEGKISLFIKETEIPKIPGFLSMYTTGIGIYHISCGYRYEFEYLDLYPSTVEQFERAKTMNIEEE